MNPYAAILPEVLLSENDFDIDFSKTNNILIDFRQVAVIRVFEEGEGKICEVITLQGASFLIKKDFQTLYGYYSGHFPQFKLN